MKFRRMLVLTAAVLLSGAAAAAMLSEQTRQKIVEGALHKGFWGKARLSDGSLAQPENEAARAVPPLSGSQADSAINVGELTAIGMWCNVEWKAYFLAYTKSLRKEGLSETQVAFAGVLHGIAQSSVLNSLQAGGQCGEQLREATKHRLQPPAPLERPTTSSS